MVKISFYYYTKSKNINGVNQQVDETKKKKNVRIQLS